MAACQILTETVPVEELPGWRSLFAPRTSAAVFSDSVSDHEVLAPTPGAFLERPQYDALLKALDTVGENEFLWMLLEVDETKVRTEAGWPTRLLCKGPPTWKQFVDERLMPLDSLLWSPKGTWGILLDHDRYALAGGSEHFIAALRRNVPAELADRTWPGDLFGLTIDDLQAPDWFQRLVATRLPPLKQESWMGGYSD